ncbi:MAG: dihydrofolate reductase [Betaproteobacteria bacterium]
MKSRISLLVAMAKNRVIGADNKLPWHLSSDLKRFKALTMGHHIVMGRKTFESIGRALPGRTSVVISRNPLWRFTGVATVDSLRKALMLAAGDSETFVIGGEQIFREALPFADRILLTEIDRDFEGDVFFPPLEAQEWRETASEDLVDEASALRYRNRTLERQS